MSSPLATLELTATSAAGESFALVVAIGPPQFESAPSTYFCEVEISQLLAPARRIFGEGSFQAVALSIQFALRLLTAFTERGGTLTDASGERFEPLAYWPARDEHVRSLDAL